jgi:hypothetical protein
MAALVLAAAGCSLIAGIANFENVEWPADADLSEAGSSAGEAGDAVTIDATNALDATVPDTAQPGDDAGADAKTDGSADADARADGSPDSADAHADGSPDAADARADGSLCDGTAHDLCDDFDNGLLGANWTGQVQNVTGTLALVTDAWVSPPRSLMASATDSDGGGSSAALLYKDIGRAAQTVHCELDVQSLSNLTQILNIELTDPSGVITSYSNNIVYGLDNSGFFDERFYNAGVYNETRYPIPVAAPGKWSHMTVDLQLSPSGSAKATLQRDQSILSQAPITPPAGSIVKDIVIGEDGNSGAFGTLFDNVFCDVR